LLGTNAFFGAKLCFETVFLLKTILTRRTRNKTTEASDSDDDDKKTMTIDEGNVAAPQ
jgi:hypothetical protein